MLKQLVSLVTVAMVGFVLSSQVSAETKIAILDSQVVLFNSAAANAATLELRTTLAPYQSQLQDIQSQIQTRQNRLQSDQAIMTEEEVAEFQLEIQNLLNNQAQLSSQLQQFQQQSRNAFVQQYEQTIQGIIAEYIEENGYTLVLNAQVVIANAGEADITEDILNLFDAYYNEQNQPAVVAE
jgi:outer membrane protein